MSQHWTFSLLPDLSLETTNDLSLTFAGTFLVNGQCSQSAVMPKDTGQSCCYCPFAIMLPVLKLGSSRVGVILNIGLKCLIQNLTKIKKTHLDK